MTLSYSGNFSSDWVLTITVSASAFFTRARTVTYMIPVQTDNTKGLWTGAVSGQAEEDGSQATFPVRLRAAPSQGVTVSVSSRDASEGTVVPSSLTFSGTNWSTVQTVTVTGVQDTVDDGTVTWQVRLDPSSGDTGYNGLTNVDVDVTTTDDDDAPGVTLALEDDESAPGATLALNPASVAEMGGVATVTATLSGLSSQPSTVTVTSVARAYTVGSDATIVIAAGSTTAASDTATVTAVDDDVHQGSAGRSVTVTGTLANGQGAGSVTGAALALEDDETLPTVALVLGPASISENGGVSSVTATLSGPSSQPVTVTVAAAAVASTGAVAGDFTLSTATTLTIAAGSTTSAGTVTVTGVDNNVDAANKQVTVSGTSAGGNGVAAPSAVTLTLADDEDTATATLVLNPAAILENAEVSTVTARLSHPTMAAATLTVAAAAGENTVSGDFTLSSTTTLTIAANATTSTGLVTITSVDNSVASGRK